MTMLTTDGGRNVPRMAAVIKSVSFDAADALTLARFWAAALGSDVDEDSTDGRAFVEAAGWADPTFGSTRFQSPRGQEPLRAQR